MSTALRPLVALHGRIDSGGRPSTETSLRRAAREAVRELAADGVIHAELRLAPHDHTGDGLDPEEVMRAVHDGIAAASEADCEARVIVTAKPHFSPSMSAQAARLAVRWMDRGVVGFDPAGHAVAFTIAAQAGLGCTAHAGDTDGVREIRSALDHCRPDRLGDGWRIIDDCAMEDGRILSLGPTAAQVRDLGIPLEIRDPSNVGPVRALFDAGFRVTLGSTRSELERAARSHGFTDVELAACVERAADAAFLPVEEREALVARVFDGWSARPARLVHLAERDRWEAADGRGAYLPGEWERDGFIHLSSLHQLLTPANRFYRGRDDLIALVVDAHRLGAAVVWEAGTGAVERFPHLYGALTPDAVLAQVPITSQPDGGFLLPPALMRAARSPLRG